MPVKEVIEAFVKLASEDRSPTIVEAARELLANNEDVLIEIVRVEGDVEANPGQYGTAVVGAIVEKGWYADDGNCAVHFPDAEDAADARRAYVDGGDWGEDEDRTRWVTVRAWRRVHVLRVDGKVVEDDDTYGAGSTCVEIEPTVPECAEGKEHDWYAPHWLVGGIKENPGVWGHGGGVVMTEACRHCGCAKVTDTWAQNPETGEQGLTSVEYEPGRYSEELYERRGKISGGVA